MANNFANLLGAGSASPAATYNTASVTPVANQLMLLAVTNSKAATPDVPTVTGNGLTWVQVATTTFSTIGSPTRRLTLFRAMGAAPTAGALAIAYGGVSQLSCTWILDTVTGMSTLGADGAGAVVQSATARADTVSTLAAALGAFGASGNSTYAAWAVQTNNTFTEKAGFTELADVGIGTTPIRSQTEWIVSNDTAPSASQAGNRNWGGIAVEVALALPAITGYVALTLPARTPALTLMARAVGMTLSTRAVALTLPGVATMTISRAVNEQGIRQGTREIIAYSLTTTPWGSSPSAISVLVTDRTGFPGTAELDVTATVMPVNTPAAVGDVITLSPLKLLTVAHTYHVAVKFTVGGQVEEAYFDVLCD